MNLKRKIEQIKDEPNPTREQLNSIELVIRDSLLSETWDKSTTDYLGNSFETKYQLAQYHGISETTLNRRVSKGLTLQECLVHLGNVYPSMEGMAYHYNIKIEILRKRLYSRWTLEDALTRPVKYIEPGKETRKRKAKKVYTLDPHSTDGSLIFST